MLLECQNFKNPYLTGSALRYTRNVLIEWRIPLMARVSYDLSFQGFMGIDEYVLKHFVSDFPESLIRALF